MKLIIQYRDKSLEIEAESVVEAIIGIVDSENDNTDAEFEIHNSTAGGRSPCNRQSPSSGLKLVRQPLKNQELPAV